MPSAHTAYDRTNTDRARMTTIGQTTPAFPPASPLLEEFGIKFSPGGAHISRTMMLVELDAALASVPVGSNAIDYRAAILERNVLGKKTDSTRRESLRRLRELYALDEGIPIFALLRKLHAMDPASLPLLALQVAWARDPLLRATTQPVLEAPEGSRIETSRLASAFEAANPNQYSELSRNQTARHAASTWTQSGHLLGRTAKTRRRVEPTVAATAMAFFLGDLAGYYGASVFSNPWCRLLDLDPARAKAMGQEAHRAGLMDLRAVGEVVQLSFPILAELRKGPA